MDLRSRLTGIDIELKPLRDRKGEIADLVRLFFHKERCIVSEKLVLGIAEKCKSYYWQGNIRQLFNVLKSFQTICLLNEEALDVSYFPEYRTMFAPSESTPITQSDSIHYSSGNSLKEMVASLEKRAILDAIETHEGNKARASRHLKISRSSFDNKVLKYNLDCTS